MDNQRLSMSGKPLTKQRLSISGKRRLTFMGAEILHESTKTSDSDSWYVVRVFETRFDYVIGISRKTTWEFEDDTFEVFRTKNEIELISIISKKVPDLDITEKLTNYGKNEAKETIECNQSGPSQKGSPGLLYPK